MVFIYQVEDKKGGVHDITVDSAVDLVGIKIYRLCHAQRYVQCSRSRDRTRMYLHQYVHGDCQPGFVIDHKDRNPLNNRRSNLREVTIAENGANIGIRKHNTTGYIGVGRRGSKYVVKIRVPGGKQKEIAVFNLDKTAAVVRDKAVELLKGDLGVYNFPDMDRTHITWKGMQHFIDMYVKK